MASKTKIAVLGAGAWGTALACNAHRAGHCARLWARSPKTVEEINTRHTNSAYLDEMKLEEGVVATGDLDEALRDANLILFAVPAQQLAITLKQIDRLPQNTVLVTTCKGIDQETGKLPSQLVAEAFPENPVAALSGPSFAADLMRGLPTAVTVASKSISAADTVARVMSTDIFRCYSSNDVIGVELGGALKNVLALAVGATRGMQLGASAEAALIARGFAEITRLAVKLGAKPETLAGLSGLGDITLTCSSPQSRNFAYGMALGRGESLKGLKLAEGAFTASVALRLAEKNKIETPITRAIVDVLEKRVTIRKAVEQLLTRPLKRES